MNHLAPKVCHPGRALSFAEREAQAQSRDLVFTCSGIGHAGSFRVAVRFFDEQGDEVFHKPNCEAEMRS